VALFADSYHEVNGVALTSREFAGFAANLGYPFFSVHSGPRTRYWREGDFETFEIAHSPFVLGLERDLSFDLLVLRHRDRIRKKLTAFSPDLVHITGPSHAGILGAILAHELRAPLVASWHTNLHEFASSRVERMLGWLPDKWRRAAAGFTEWHSLEFTLRFYRLARLLFAPNPELVNLLATRTGRSTHLMQRGIDTSLFSPARRTRRDGEFVIGFVGRLSPEKNVRMLAELERPLRDAGVGDYRFLIVGDGSEATWLSRHLERASLPGVLRGPALAEAYANMDVFVFPSRTDTFGNVVLEAMASGVPVVVSARGGPKFLVRPHRNGYIAQTPADFARALMGLRSHPSLRAALARGARETALTLSWESVFERVYQHYSDLLARTPEAPSADSFRSVRAIA